MITKYPGKCKYCGLKTKPHQDHYDVDTKESYHALCRIQAEGAAPEPDELAERLGFTHFSWDSLRILPGEDVLEPERPDRAPRERRAVRTVPTSDEISINDVRGEEAY